MTARLLGTTAASLIAISTSMGSAADTWTPPAANSGSGTISQLNTLAQPVAPCAIKLGISSISGMGVTEDVSNTWVRDPAVHDIHWNWSVVGQSATPFEQSSNLQLQTHEDDKFSGQGKSCSFMFDTPGTYTVQCSGISISGETLTETFEIVVRDPDVEYPNTRTICVSTSGTFTGAPSGSTQVTTISAAQAAAEALSGQTHRVLLRYGETFIGTYTIDNSIVNTRLSAFGTPADGKPIWTMDSRSNDQAIVFGSGNLCEDFVEHDIVFQGLWDAPTQSGYPEFMPCVTSTHNTVANTCMSTLNCEFYGIETKRVGAGVAGYTHIVFDSLIEGWRDYGMFQQAFGATSETGKIDLRGVAIIQEADAMVNNNGKTTGLTNDHGPVRIADARNVSIQQCNFFSGNSWGVGVQPSLRLSQVGSSGSTTYGWHNEVHATNCEGGGVSCTAQNSGSPTYPGNHLFDGVRTFGTWADFAYHFLMGHGGVTIRNHVAWQFAPGSLSAYYVLEIDNDGSGGGLSASTARCDVVGNTLIDLSTSSFGAVSNGEGDRTAEEIADNLIYQPNGGTNSHTNLTTTSFPFVPRNRGKRDGPLPSNTSISSTANSATVDLTLPSGMSDSEFDVSANHVMRAGGVSYTVSLGDFTVTKLGNGNVRLTNTSGETWSAGTAYLSIRPLDSLLVDNAKYGTDTSLASPSSVTVPRPGSGSDAIGAATSAVSFYKDALGAVRPGPSETGNDLDGNPRATGADDIGAVLAL